MSRKNQRENQFLLISGDPDVIRRFRGADPATVEDAEDESHASTSRPEAVVVKSVVEAERTLRVAALAKDPVRVVVVDSAWLKTPGPDIAAQLWSDHSSLTVVDCSAEESDDIVDEQLLAVVQPARYSILRLPFAKTQAEFLIRRLLRSARREEQFAAGSRALEQLQDRVDRLETQNAALLTQIRLQRMHADSGQTNGNQRPATELPGDSGAAPVTRGPAVRHISIPESDSQPKTQTDQTRRRPASRSEQSDESRLNGRILVADDHPASLRLLRFLLERAGADVTTCGDGIKALELCRRTVAAGQSFDAIVLDIVMPQLDGVECARRMRAAGYAGPLIAVTGRDLPEDFEDGERGGFDAWITKPVDRNQFVRTLSESLARAADGAVSST